MVTVTTKAGIPMITVDGVDCVYMGTDDRESIEKFVEDVRRTTRLEEGAGESATFAASVNALDDAQRGALESWIWGFVDYLEPGWDQNLIRGLAAWAGDNRPLVAFLQCQQYERQIMQAQNARVADEVVMFGPTHRAVLEVLAGLEALTR